LGRVFYFFFFQAEDGIRDLYVTGVQTCALPISSIDRAVISVSSGVVTCAGSGRSRVLVEDDPDGEGSAMVRRRGGAPWGVAQKRSEERRVGKECRSRGSPYHAKENVEN